MAQDLVRYEPPGQLEQFRGSFQVPAKWIACGPVIYVSGAPGVGASQAMALALTNSSLSLCGRGGPVWSLPLTAITDVRVEELRGITLPVDTPAGVFQMVPPAAMAVGISYHLTVGATSQVLLFVLTPQAAFEWVNDIQSAIYRHANDLNASGGIERRQG